MSIQVKVARIAMSVLVLSALFGGAIYGDDPAIPTSCPPGGIQFKFPHSLYFTVPQGCASFAVAMSNIAIPAVDVYEYDGSESCGKFLFSCDNPTVPATELVGKNIWLRVTSKRGGDDVFVSGFTFLDERQKEINKTFVHKVQWFDRQWAYSGLFFETACPILGVRVNSRNAVAPAPGKNPAGEVGEDFHDLGMRLGLSDLFHGELKFDRTVEEEFQFGLEFTLLEGFPFKGKIGWDKVMQLPVTISLMGESALKEIPSAAEVCVMEDAGPTGVVSRIAVRGAKSCSSGSIEVENSSAIGADGKGHSATSYKLSFAPDMEFKDAFAVEGTALFQIEIKFNAFYFGTDEDNVLPSKVMVVRLLGADGKVIADLRADPAFKLTKK